MSRECSHPLPIVVAGAGIAGLSAAIALKEAGFKVAVHERDSTVRIVGAGLQLGPSATRRLERLGVDVEQVASYPGAVRLCQARTGRLLTQMPLGGEMKTAFGAPYITILRSDLQSALFARARALDIPVYFGTPITAAEQEDGALQVRSPRGQTPALALIGADGVYSSIRRFIASSPSESYSHSLAFRGLIPRERAPDGVRDSVTVWMAPGIHLVHYPVARGAQLNVVLVLDEYRKGARFGQRETVAAEEVQQFVSGWADVPRAVVGACAEWLCWPLMLAPGGEGGSGRIQLIGDAWHAMAPHLASGAVLALEDATELADAMARLAPDVPAALQAFREERQPRIKRAFFASARMGRVYQFPRPFDAIRDAVLAAVPGQTWLESYSWLYRA